MTLFGTIIIGILAVLVVLLGQLVLFYKWKARRANRGELRWPIPTVALDHFDPVFAHGPLGPTLRAEVRFLGEGDGVPGGASDRETWILSALAKDARRLFEFGTCTGKTAYLWAVNAPSDAEVSTLTLGPDELGEYQHAAGDSAAAEGYAIRESTFTEFYYSGTPAATKIQQLFGDSKRFDEAPFLGRCDLIFVDGSHAYSYVESDSRRALRMVAPGGIVLWHDYRGPFGETRDVFRFLNTLAREAPLIRFKGTSLVAYRAPGDSHPPR